MANTSPLGPNATPRTHCWVALEATAEGGPWWRPRPAGTRVTRGDPHTVGAEGDAEEPVCGVRDPEAARPSSDAASSTTLEPAKVGAGVARAGAVGVEHRVELDEVVVLPDQGSRGCIWVT